MKRILLAALAALCLSGCGSLNFTTAEPIEVVSYDGSTIGDRTPACTANPDLAEQLRAGIMAQQDLTLHGWDLDVISACLDELMTLPDYFWFRGYHISASTGLRTTAEITFRWLYEDGPAKYNELCAKADEILAAAPWMGDYSVALYVYDWLAQNVTYAESEGYDQTAYSQTGYNNTSFAPAYGQQQGGQTNYFRQDPAPRQDYVGKGSFTGQNGFPMAKRSNISYMPGVEPGAGRGQVHVEHIVTLTGLKSCYEAIEYMKDGETLIVMLDAIANESESMRCQDMLAGAAFTLGCSVRLLQGARIVVIAPEGVKILPEQAALNMAPMAPAAPIAQAAPRAQDMQATRMVATMQVPVRREHRTSANAAEWNAARNGQLDGYNPYTGTMPVAAGAYASFGGYGM